MAESARRVVAGEVTRAVRDATGPAGPIRAGDWMGLSRDGVEVVGESVAEATCGLLGKLLHDDHELVTLIEGEGAGAGETRRVTEWLAEHRPDVAVEVHHGASRCTRTSSASSEPPHRTAHGMRPAQARRRRAMSPDGGHARGTRDAHPSGRDPGARGPQGRGQARRGAGAPSTSRPSSTSSPTTPAATSTGPGKPTWRACAWARSPWCWRASTRCGPAAPARAAPWSSSTSTTARERCG